jgi:flagellar hook-associated protein 1 FlgK
VGNVQRMVSDYLVQSEVEQAARLGGTGVRADIAGRLDTMFSEPEGAGIAGRLEQFFQGVNDLANTPSGEAERTQLLEQGRELASVVRQRDERIHSLQLEVDKRIDQDIDEINAKVERIADLNSRIVEAEAATSGEALQMRDTRDKLTRELAEKVGINYYEDGEGNYNIALKGTGHSLVERGEHYTLDRAGSISQGFDTFAGIQLEERTSLDLSQQLAGGQGELGELLNLRDEVMVDLRSRMDDWAKTLVGEVNKLHSQGAGLNYRQSMTGEFGANQTSVQPASANAELPFGDLFQGGTIEVATRNQSTGAIEVESHTFGGGETLDQIVNDLDGALANVSVGLNASNQVTMQAAAGHDFAIKSDGSQMLAATGVNAFFGLENGRNVATGGASAAGNLALADNVEGEPKRIAAGQLVPRLDADGNPVPDASGTDDLYEIAVSDNRTALALGDLQFEKFGINGKPPTTFMEHYAGTVGQAGQEKATADSLQSHQQRVMDQIRNQREQHSGVNIDEEMVNMLNFQRAYQAASKVITTADEMFASLLQSV